MYSILLTPSTLDWKSSGFSISKRQERWPEIKTWFYFSKAIYSKKFLAPAAGAPILEYIYNFVTCFAVNQMQTIHCFRFIKTTHSNSLFVYRQVDAIEIVEKWDSCCINSSILIYCKNTLLLCQLANPRSNLQHIYQRQEPKIYNF